MGLLFKRLYFKNIKKKIIKIIIIIKKVIEVRKVIDVHIKKKKVSRIKILIYHG